MLVALDPAETNTPLTIQPAAALAFSGASGRVSGGLWHLAGAFGFQSGSIPAHSLDRALQHDGAHRPARRRGGFVLRETFGRARGRRAGGSARDPYRGQSTPTPGTTSPYCSRMGTTPPGWSGALRNAGGARANWFKPHLALAELFALTGRRDEARAEAGKAFLLDAGKDPEGNRSLPEARALSAQAAEKVLLATRRRRNAYATCEASATCEPR